MNAKLLIILAFVPSGLAFANGGDDLRLTDPSVGSIHDGALYAITNKQRSVASGAIFAQLARAPLISKNKEHALAKPERIEILVDSADGDDQPVRWRIARDILWNSSFSVAFASVSRLKILDFELFDENNPQAEQKTIQRYGGMLKREEIGHYLGGWQFEMIKGHAENMRRLPIFNGKGFEGLEPLQRIRRELAFYDFLPSNEVSGRLFLLEDKKVKIWSVLAEFKFYDEGHKLRDWWITYSKDPIATIDLGFTEPFTVFSHKGSYFFLTRSCKLYSATKGADDKWKVEKLWSEASRPIHAVITDTKTNSTYAFTQAKADKDGKKPSDVYFDFDTKLTPIEFDRGKLTTYKLDPPLDILRSYTQILIDAKKIDPTPPMMKKKE